MATLLQVNNLSKTFGNRVILDNASFTVAEKQKIGVIGRNGAGKSTLFKIIVGDEKANAGSAVVQPIARLGYLTQHDPYSLSETILQFLLRSSGKEEWECAKMAGKFQIKNQMLTSPIGSLSGGYQMRVKLIDLLLHDPNLLLLDEPTNYLDLSTLLLLEKFLQTFRGSFLVISHDREFLKNTCTETLEIENGKTFLFPGPVEAYLAHKEEQVEMMKRYNKKIEREKRHLQDFVDQFRYKASKATQAQSKLKQIEKLKTIEIEHPLRSSRIRIPLIENRTGLALRVDHMNMGYPQRCVAEDVMVDVERGEHIAIVGDNGQGKTTFLKTIAGELSPLAGTFRWGPHMRVGYYAQHVPQAMRGEETVFHYLERKAGPEMKREQVLQMAGNFLFRDEDLEKSISLLSGGEKARLCLAGLLFEKNDVLLLDEPTNHLDFETVEALAEALHECNSTVMFISHNRTFVNMLATGIIEVKNGKVLRYFHNYEEYVYHLEQTMQEQSDMEGTEVSVTTSTVSTGTEREILRSEIKKHKRTLQKIEAEVEQIEKEKKRLINWFSKHPTEYSREKTEQLDRVSQSLEEKEKNWMEIQSQIEALEKKI